MNISEGGLLQKLLSFSDSTNKLILNSQQLNRAISSHNESNLTNFPLNKSNINYSWLNLFLTDFTIDRKIYFTNLIDKFYTENCIDTKVINSQDHYLQVQLTECPKLFIQKFKEVLQLLLKNSQTFMTLDNLILADGGLSKIESVYTDLTEKMGKLYNGKSKKIQTNLESQEKLLNKATNLTLNYKLKNKGKDQDKTRQKNIALKKQNGILLAKSQDSEQRVKELVSKNIELLKEKECTWDNNLNGKNANFEKNIKPILLKKTTNDKKKKVNEHKTKKSSEKESIVKMDSIQYQNSYTCNNNENFGQKKSGSAKSDKQKDEIKTSISKNIIESALYRQNSDENNIICDNLYTEIHTNNQNFKAVVKKKILKAKNNFHTFGHIMNNSKSLDNPFSFNHKNTELHESDIILSLTKILLNCSVESIQFVKNSQTKERNSKSIANVARTKANINHFIQSKKILNTEAYYTNGKTSKLADSSFTPRDSSENVNITSSMVYNRDRDYSRDLSKENKFPIQNQRFTSVESRFLPCTKVNQSESRSHSGSMGINRNNFLSPQCLIQDGFDVGAPDVVKKKDNFYIFRNKNYNEFLGQFVEILPKFEKKKDIVLDNCVFLKSILEMAFFLQANSSSVIYSAAQEMVEAQSPLPIKFIPKTKFWFKYTPLLSNEKNESQKPALRKSSYLDYTPLLANTELNSLFHQVLTNIALHARVNIEDIKSSMNSNFNKLLMEGDNVSYPKTYELKRSLKNKTKNVNNLLDLNKIYFLCNLINRKISPMGFDELIINDNEIIESINHSKYSRMPQLCHELKNYYMSLQSL